MSIRMSLDGSMSAAESIRLAKKLKTENFEQFNTLVRMHLSFILELNTDDHESPSEKTKFKPLKWGFTPFSKKSKSVNYPAITQGCLNKVIKLIEFLSKEENLVQEGIFRRSGKLTRQQELKSLLLQGGDMNFENGQYSVHDCASVLKYFLADLPEPLITEANYLAYCQIADLCKNEPSEHLNERVLKGLQLLMLSIPTENRKLFKEIVRLLHLTASHEASNRMSPENLSTIFTPHLLCSRKVSPEEFQTSAQNLYCVVVFMVVHGMSIFDVPIDLALDIKNYLELRRTPNPMLEESISESNTAKTVFTFVDRELSSKDVVDSTQAALAQLYAHVQSLPDSNKNKKSLIKKFNKENGHGTPRSSKKAKEGLGDSLKKNLFNMKCQRNNEKKMKSTVISRPCPNGTDAAFHSPDPCPSPEPEMSQDEPDVPHAVDKMPRIKPGLLSLSVDDPEPGNQGLLDRESLGSLGVEPLPLPAAAVQPALPTHPAHSAHMWNTALLTSTPALPGGDPVFFTPSPPPLGQPQDMSPITRSTQRMPKAMQEAMVTPRSRRPVVALSGSNLLQLGTTKEGDGSWTGVNIPTPVQEDPRSPTENNDSLTSPFKDYLFTRSVLSGTPTDLSFSSRTGDFDPSSEEPLSDSLLYCLDRGTPPRSSDTPSPNGLPGPTSRKRPSDSPTSPHLYNLKKLNMSSSTFSEGHITETAL